MARKHFILRGLGILFGLILLVFALVFFFAYSTGGDSKVLSLFSGDGVGVLQIDGAIDDPQVVLNELRRFKEMPWVKAIVVRIDSPGGAVAPTQEIFEEIQRAKKKKPLIASMGSIGDLGRLLYRRGLRQDCREPWHADRFHRRDHAIDQRRRADEKSRRQRRQRQERRQQRHRLAVSTAIARGPGNSTIAGG